MPAVTFNFTAAQQARIAEAAALYNAQHGDIFTVKQFVFLVCVKPEVLRRLRDAAALQAVTTGTPAIESDLGTEVT